jgi:hypothetical protein
LHQQDYLPDTGWSVIGDGLGDGIGSDTYTINFDASLTEAQREAVLDAFMIQPPAHSSKDLLAADFQVLLLRQIPTQSTVLQFQILQPKPLVSASQ